jgi:hypothetical protein
MTVLVGRGKSEKVTLASSFATIEDRALEDERTGL